MGRCKVAENLAHTHDYETSLDGGGGEEGEGVGGKGCLEPVYWLSLAVQIYFLQNIPPVGVLYTQIHRESGGI